MDVQTLGAAQALNSPADQATFVQDGAMQASGLPQSAGLSAFPAVPGAPATTVPAPPLPSFQLPHDVAKVFVGSDASNVTVSFKVDHNPNEIVTVFKDSRTGAVITQVPSEIMIKMAEFFDQVAGVVLDKSA